ncbi:MAG: LamG domain-containing protein, partial [Ignavibacteria bacterium]|nr:LamG domain-containing protein [Ignavibacteria bacterium]
MKKLIQSISLLLLTTAVLSAQPKWNPLIYTNSTTLYGKVMINGAPAQLGDKVGVFVGDECRGVADVVSNLGEGYVSILIQGEVSEEASFKIWKQNNDVVYKVFKKVITSPGGTIGTPPEYFLIDGNGPDWKPVVYTNSTTLYGIITINNISAQAGDVVGVFVNGECRGSEEVIMNNDTSYVTMLIQGETVENVSFQIWQASSGKELLVPKQISSDPGGTISFININAVDGLVALYSFNNNLNDETKNGFDLSGSGLNFVQDRFNNRNSAIAFDGTTSQAEVSNSASLDFPKNGFTISTWVKFKNNTNAVIFGKHVHGYFNGYFLASVNNQLQFYISGTPISAPELSNDDKWHLVTGVYDGVNATLYIDGVQKITQPIAYTTLSPNPLRLAYMQTPGYPERYNGLIDDARIYNVPLSQTDVSNLFSENNWTAQGIYNLNPDGENRIKANSIYRIDWSATQYIDSVKIEFTPDDGNTWQVVAPSLPGHSESFYWKVPRISTTQAKIRISHLTSGVSAISSAPFIIDLPQITVTSPNSGEFWQSGSSQNISWTSSNFQQAKIDYSTDGGSNWINIASSVPASVGNFNWTVVNDTSRNTLIRVSDADDSTFFDKSDAPFTIFQPKLNLVKPLGGERYVFGTPQNVTWTSEYVNKVKIEFSQDNGANWIVIPGADSVLASLTTFAWTPNVEAKFAKIRISDSKNVSLQSISSAFEIFKPKVTVTAPYGGEQWVVGTTQSITWTSSNVANVELEYTTNNGTNWNSILTSTPASAGSYIWTIPNTPSTNCKVRISDVTNSLFADTSDNVFSIILPKVTVTSPNGGEQWIVGATQNITWTSSNVANVKLEYTTNNGTNWISILTSTPASIGSYVWTIPNTPSTNCKVRISDVTNNLFADTSDNVFSIILPKVTVTTPNGGEQWIVGATQSITWTSSNVANVKLEYTTNNGTNWNSILTSIPASVGSYVWTIPNTPSTNCKVRISDVTNSLFADTSDNVFSIILPKVTVTAPNGAEQWIVGTTQSITWTSSNVANVKLEYTTNNGTNWNSILTSTPASVGSFVWTIPNTPSTNCLVRVSDVANIAVPDLSDNVFSIILPKVTVTAPNGGEQWIVGTTQNITWTSSNVANVKLEYTTNNGTNWISILTSTPAAAGSFVWTIPNTPSTNCLVRVSDVANIAVPDLSDNVFSIILPKVTVTSPNGAEQWIVGTTQNITWTSSNVANVKLEYTTNNGTNWNSILISTPASVGSYVWTIPNTPSTNCLVRVSDVTNIA